MTVQLAVQLITVLLCVLGFLRHTMTLAKRDGASDPHELKLWLTLYSSSKGRIKQAYEVAVNLYQHPLQMQKKEGWNDKQAEIAQQFTERSLLIIKNYCNRTNIDLENR